MAKNKVIADKPKKKSIVPTIILSIISVAWIYPIVMILLNSLKIEFSNHYIRGILSFLQKRPGMALRTLLPVLHRWISLHLSGTAL